MKTRETVTAALAVFVLLIISVGAQQPPAESKPFNVKASQRWQQLEKAREEIIREANRQLVEINGQQKAMREVADIPEDWPCKADDKGIVVCVSPETAKAASPEKK